MSTLWPKILVIGKNGQIGWELQRTLAPLGQIVALDYPEIDLANPDSIRSKVHDIKPSLIVNAAAYTAVDKAEEEPELAMAVNGTAPGILAEEAQKIGAFLVHYSTDYVFDGTKTTPYTEEDEPNPINVYGATKLAGEKAIQAVNPNHLIFRTSWVYGLRGKNFLLTMLRLAKERNEIRVVDDQIGSPTWCRMVAEATALIMVQGKTPVIDKSGLYHLTAGGQTSWYGFAKSILYFKTDINTEIIPIKTCEYLTKSNRPLYSVLDNKKLQCGFNIKILDWKKSLEKVLNNN
ncbi:dTDP-4-dehydrorhamnose reductase [Syntrophomonas erecta]